MYKDINADDKLRRHLLRSLHGAGTHMWHVFLCTSSACSEKICVAYTPFIWHYATACYQLRDQQVSHEDYETIIMGLMPNNPAFNDAANKLDLIGKCVGN